jgi:hypothetical protein
VGTDAPESQGEMTIFIPFPDGSEQRKTGIACANTHISRPERLPWTARLCTLPDVACISSLRLIPMSWVTEDMTTVMIPSENAIPQSEARLINFSRSSKINELICLME